MTGDAATIARLIVLLGAIMIAALLIKALCLRIRVPPLAGHLLMGVCLASVNAWRPFLSEMDHSVIEFLGKLGVIALLVAVGLQSDLKSLISQLRRASPIWLLSVLVAAIAGYAAARWLLDASPLASLVIAVALTATSVGVPSAVWENENAIDTDEGRLFVDVAELDDISGVLLAAMLFSVLASLGAEADAAQTSLDSIPVGALATTGAVFVLRLAALVAGCYLFARFVEGPLLRFFERVERHDDALISTTALSAIIAGIAGLLGFSVAIGGFLAGLAFSGRAERLRDHAVFTTIYSVTVPFFFIVVGLQVEPSGLGGAAIAAIAVVFVAAVLGKLLGVVLPALPTIGAGAALLLGVSMIPRAEITMIIAGRALAAGALPQPLYNALVATALLTCLLAPVAIRLLLRRHRRARETDQG